MSPGNDNYAAMRNSGAMGFVLKSSGIKIFVKAINSLRRGEKYFSNEQS
jgi:DNA-binding NarL/FixJ family response regulator